MNVECIIEKLKAMYAECFGVSDMDALSVTELPQAGGDRRYFRLISSQGSCIGTYTPDCCEGKCFVRLAKGFKMMECPVPDILSCSDDSHFYLQEDLGDVSLFSTLNDGGYDLNVDATLQRLVQLQKTSLKLWHDDVVCPDFCRRQILWDLNYFKYEFLKPSDVAFDENCLEDDFDLLCERLLSIPTKYWGFMMRDCQSRNVLLSDRGPVFIDFQGGRRGPVLYDAVSLLWQARAPFSKEFRDVMIWRYAKAFCDDDKDLALDMLSYLPDIIIFRTLQVLGAYGFRGLVQKRSHFILSIPGALSNLRNLLRDGALDEYPELKRLSSSLIENPRFTQPKNDGKLRVEVFSFSYKKGYPEDLTGNGGGFMFDCRAMHNPGRYKEYKTLTGRDLPVKAFLEKRGEVQAFLKNAWSLIDPAIEKYISRGFTNIQIGFGCTGGQHRSVYCAEATAGHIGILFPEAEVILVHKEHPVSDK